MFSDNGFSGALLYALIGSSDDSMSIVLSLLYLVGLWRVFQKCGMKGWWALVPVARTYKLSVCADRESGEQSHPQGYALCCRAGEIGLHPECCD